MAAQIHKQENDEKIMTELPHLHRMDTTSVVEGAEEHACNGGCKKDGKDGNVNPRRRYELSHVCLVECS